jgi:hypothetical protein
MLGVAGLGAYAAYRMVRPPSGPSSAFDLAAPRVAGSASPFTPRRLAAGEAW